MYLNRTIFVSAAALLFLGLAPAVGADSSTDGCNVSYSTVAYHYKVEDMYVYGVSVWQETNGVPGLQIRSIPCGLRPSIPADACIVGTSEVMTLRCLIEYPQSL